MPAVDAPRWDLTDLYSGATDPALAADLDRAQQEACTLRDRFRGKVASLSAAELASALQAMEALTVLMTRIGGYAALLFSTDAEDPAAKALQDRVMVRGTEIENTLTFFSVELKAVAAATFEAWLADEALATYRYHLEQTRKFAPFTLSEEQEQLLALKAVTGVHAWNQLYTELTSTMTVTVRVGGEEREVTLSEARTLRSDPDRQVRESASRGLLSAFADRALVIGTVFNTVYQDHGQDVALRGYPSAIAPTLLGDDLPEAVVEALLSAIEGTCDLVQEYYRIKAEALAIPDFASYDTLAPYGRTSKEVGFDEGRELVMTAFAGFSPDFSDIARRFFDGRWIDAPPGPGKRGGAFCSGMAPGLHPYVLLNYTRKMQDVMTLAHELGHGIHFVLSADQTPFNYHAITPLAETASTFAEIVVTNHLLATESDPQVRLQLLATRLEDAISTIFRQVMYTRWELTAHARRSQGVIAPEEFCAMWAEANRKLYGDAVRMTELDPWGWSTIPHLVHYRFYCYSYAFGQLLVYALYQRFLEEGQAFLPRLVAVLRAGGSAPPTRILQSVGVDVTDPAFWDKGLVLLRRMLAEFQAALPALRA